MIGRTKNLENKHKVLLTVIFLSAITLTGFLSYAAGFANGGFDGYFRALSDVKDFTDVDFSWEQNPDGSYTVTYTRGAQTLSSNVEVDCYTVLQDLYGNVKSATRNAGVLTNIGADWIEDQLGDTPSTDPAKWIAVDDSGIGGLSASSTQLTSELAASGLTRAEGTYASAGTGSWTITKAFSVTGTVTANAYSLQWSVTSQSDNNMLCYDSSSDKNCINGDTLTVEWTVTIS